MKKLIIGGLAALAIGLGVAPVAGADPGNDECCENEFDGFDPYLAAFQRHSIGYLADIPIPERRRVVLPRGGDAGRHPD